jgi:hypothetical protein
MCCVLQKNSIVYNVNLIPVKYGELKLPNIQVAVHIVIYDYVCNNITNYIYVDILIEFKLLSRC